MTTHRCDGATSAQLAAREAFDLDAAMGALPQSSYVPPQSARGAAGVRLRSYLRADISDERLREFARETLGARRMSEQYLDTLRVVLGNQAHAERHGYTLELNVRTSFAPENVMRSILKQMRVAAITEGRRVGLGVGKVQLVQTFGSGHPEWVGRADAATELERLYRRREGSEPCRTDDRFTDVEVPY